MATCRTSWPPAITISAPPTPRIADTQINTYFKATDNPLNDPAQGGILKGVMTPGEIQNAYYDFTAPDGRKMLVFCARMGAAAGDRRLGKSNRCPAGVRRSHRRAAHAWLSARQQHALQRQSRGGRRRWTRAVARISSGSTSNFEMTFNGHFGGDGAGYLASTANDGNMVHQMFLNTQFETHGGDGWMRIVEFLDDGKTVRVRTYSTLHDITRLHPDFQFEFEISQIELPPKLLGRLQRGRHRSMHWTTWSGATISARPLTRGRRRWRRHRE